MNRSEQIIDKIDEVESKTAHVKPEHIKEVDNYLSKHRVKHRKTKHTDNRYGIPYYYGYGIRSEAWSPFLTNCAHCMCNGPSGDTTGATVDVGTAAGSETGGNGVSGT